MSTPTSNQSKRRNLLSKLWDLGRKMSTQTVFLHQAIAQSVGLNATDTKCIDLILRAPGGCVTAGLLSDLTGLTTGAITHILDRLERRQFIERVRDTQDRRKVLIRVRTESLEPLIPKYEAIGKAYMSLVDEYDDEELQLICSYLEKTSEVSERELANMISANRLRSSEAKSTPSSRSEKRPLVSGPTKGPSQAELRNSRPTKRPRRATSA
jgi:DNA-binding MarR family transcriptional regulator